MINTIVLVQKQRGQPLFSIFDLNKKLLASNIQYVVMSDVNFLICEKNKQVYLDTGQYTDHAWVEGVLKDAMPNSLRLTPIKLETLNRGIMVDYKLDSKGFTLATDKTLIETATSAIGFRGKLRVIL